LLVNLEVIMPFPFGQQRLDCKELPYAVKRGLEDMGLGLRIQSHLAHVAIEERECGRHDHHRRGDQQRRSRAH